MGIKHTNFFQGKTIWIIGANSDIVRSFLLRIADPSCHFKLFSRNTDDLERFVKEHGIQAECLYMDITDYASVTAVTESSEAPDGVIIAAGYSPPMNCEGNVDLMERTIATNYSGCVVFLESIKKKMMERRSGFISVVSSLGGERGKASNSIYASSKSALTCYCEGLEQELFPYGIIVSCIKPGWVKTKMTVDLPHVQKSFLTQSPEQVAEIIHRAIEKRWRGSVYSGLCVWSIGIAIRNIPGFIYRRLKM